MTAARLAGASMRTAAQTGYQRVAIANACFGSLLTMTSSIAGKLVLLPRILRMGMNRIAKRY